MPSFGERLKREREQRGVTLDDICVSTKISPRLLQALEEDHFEQLPGGMFNKSFVRAYARHLRLDEDEFVQDYLKASGEAPRPAAFDPIYTPPVTERHQARSASGVSWPMFAALAGLAIFGFFGLRQYSQRQQEQPVSAVATVLPSAPARQAPPDSPAAAVIPVISKNGRFTVLIKAREDCWVSVTADGKPLFEQTLEGPAEKVVQADDRLVIRAGNIGALDLFFDGKPVPSQGDYGEVKTLAFDPTGLRPVPRPATESASPQ